MTTENEYSNQAKARKRLIAFSWSAAIAAAFFISLGRSGAPTAVLACAAALTAMFLVVALCAGFPLFVDACRTLRRRLDEH